MSVMELLKIKFKLWKTYLPWKPQKIDQCAFELTVNESNFDSVWLNDNSDGTDEQDKYPSSTLFHKNCNITNTSVGMPQSGICGTQCTSDWKKPREMNCSVSWRLYMETIKTKSNCMSRHWQNYHQCNGWH